MEKMAQYQYFKVVQTQHIFEVYKYEKLNVNGGGHRDFVDGAQRDENYKNRQKVRRDSIRRLVCANFDSGSKFVTLTFRDGAVSDIRDVKVCNYYFMNFVKRVRYRYPDFKYVAVIEFQDKRGRGAVHYHMICNLPYVDKKELQDIWRGGFVKINAIDKVDNVGAYVIKYMTSDMDDKRLQGLDAYLHSKRLIQPSVAFSWANRAMYEQTLDLIEQLEKEKSPSYAATYKSEHAGDISYQQFNLAK